MDYKTKPTSREELRGIARFVRKLFKCKNKYRFDVILGCGDREHDIFGAKEVGSASLGVLYGYGSEEELKEAGADDIADAPCAITSHCLQSQGVS